MHHDRPGFLYNVSWEVCNRVGGVHTVLETIAPHLVASYGKNLLYVGPDLWADRAAQVGFIEDNTAPPLAHLAAERGVPVRVLRGGGVLGWRGVRRVPRRLRGRAM